MAKARSMGKDSPSASAHAAQNPLTNSSQSRQHMIAEAAYYRALQRNFEGGDPVEDWLEAEKEIELRLPKS